MYQTYNPMWLAVTGVGFLIACVLTARLQKRRKLNGPAWIPLACGLGYGACVILAIGVVEFDKYQKRRELRAIVPAEISQLILTSGDLKKIIIEPSAISAFLFQIQQVKRIRANHSHRLGRLDVSFRYRGREYQYLITRDSIVEDKYWIEGGGGGVLAPDLTNIVEKLLRGQPAKKD